MEERTGQDVPPSWTNKGRLVKELRALDASQSQSQSQPRPQTEAQDLETGNPMVISTRTASCSV